jgi:hypothetical protein
VAFTEFYCHPTTGSNLNAGSTEASPLTYTAGSWVASTGVFTVASGNPTSDGVAVGQFASVYPTGATVGVFVGRVTARTSTTITVSLSAKAGTAPVDGTGTRELRVGGRWKGPNALEDFPFGFMVQALNDGTNLTPRVNFYGPSGGATTPTYSVTGAISHVTADTDPVVFQGYNTTPGDGVAAIIDGTIVGASYTVLTFGSTTCRRMWMEDFIFDNNGSTGTATAITFASTMGGMKRVLVKNMRGTGINATAVGGLLVECYATDCNLGLGSQLPAIQTAGHVRLIRCVASGNTSHGFGTGTGNSWIPALYGCIANHNGGSGFSFRATSGSAGVSLDLVNCDFSDNTQDGLRIEATTLGGAIFIENTNFIKNGGWGINQVDALMGLLSVLNCGFGAGSQANVSGTINAVTTLLVEEGTVTYASGASPYKETGAELSNRRIVSPEALNAGEGSFPRGPSNTINTTGHPDIGAAAGIPVRFRSRRTY